MTFSRKKFKAQMSPFIQTWQKRRSSLELVALSFETAFEKITSNGIGCIYAGVYMYRCVHVHIYWLQGLVVNTRHKLHTIVVATTCSLVALKTGGPHKYGAHAHTLSIMRTRTKKMLDSGWQGIARDARTLRILFDFHLQGLSCCDAGVQMRMSRLCRG